MVEPTSLAAAAVGLLAPYLPRLAGRLAEQTADAIADSALPAVKRLYEAVKAKLRPGTYSGTQLEGVAERPESEGRQQALRTALAEEIESDPAFAAELEQLVAEAQAAVGVQVVATDAGVVAGRDVTQRGKYVAGRDQRIGDPSREER